MPKAVSPAVGFNDNVRRRNRNFHVQTEDSGVAHPHIITHLFTDGGRIVKSVRHSYADIVAEENLTKRVRERMKGQHVGMLEALKSGEFDALVWGSRAPGAKAKAAAAPSVAGPVSASVESSIVSSGTVSSDGPVPTGSELAVDDLVASSAPSDVTSSPQPKTAAPTRLPTPPRRSTPPIAQRKPLPPARKTMPRMEAMSMPLPALPATPAAVVARARKSVPPKARRTSRPPPRSISRPTATVANPRDGLVSQTLDEVILRMLSEEQDTKSGS